MTKCKPTQLELDENIKLYVLLEVLGEDYIVRR